MTIEGFAPAKINLTLHVTGQRDDGYHLLDSLVVFADVGDRLTFAPGPDLTLTISGEFSAGVPTDARNLVWQAAKAAGWTGDIALTKVLPHGGGIGGGSSDAAATLRAIAGQGCDIPPDVPLSLGADVPVCMQTAATRMRGIGEDLSPITLPPLPALLVNPGVAVPTGTVFQAMTCRENPAMPAAIRHFQGAQDCAAWLSEQRNDLQTAAIGVAPAIETVLEELQATSNAVLARMSGSGSTCFALYPTMKDAHFAAYEIGTAYPDWWCRAATLGSPGL